jgi:hypothetical protein
MRRILPVFRLAGDVEYGVGHEVGSMAERSRLTDEVADDRNAAQSGDTPGIRQDHLNSRSANLGAHGCGGNAGVHQHVVHDRQSGVLEDGFHVLDG